MLFFVLCDSKLNMFRYLKSWLDKTRDMKMSSKKQQWVFFNVCGHFMDNQLIYQQNNQQSTMKIIISCSPDTEQFFISINPYTQIP